MPTYYGDTTDTRSAGLPDSDGCVGNNAPRISEVWASCVMEHGAVPTIPANATHSRGEASQQRGMHTGAVAELARVAPLIATSKLRGVER
jgi:hypothetical protein